MLLSMIDRRTDILAGDRCCRGMVLQNGRDFFADFIFLLCRTLPD